MNAKATAFLAAGALILGLVGGACVGARLVPHSSGSSSDAQLRADRDTYQRADEQYFRDQRRLENDLAAAQESARRAEGASRDALARFDEYRAGVERCDAALLDAIRGYADGARNLGDGLGSDIDLVDRCLRILGGAGD